MAKSKNALSDDEIVSICQSEIDTASGYASGELSAERAQALDFYNGEPYGDEVDGRSQIVTREVLETVEWILPSLVRIFADTDNLISFDPVNEEDIEQAKLETELCNYVFWKQNRGFYNIYSFLKDALLSKTGLLKVWWDDKADEEREEYTGLDDMQLGELMGDTSIDREILEYEETPEGHSVTFHTVRSKGQIRIEPIPPEEFGISRDARSPYIQDSNFCYHRSRKSFSDLVEMGVEPDLIRTLPANDDVETEERIARRNLDDEDETLDWSNTESMRKYWITECYAKLDRNGDDVAEIIKVTLAAGSYTAAGARLIDIEEVDEIPFVAIAPVLLTHKFYGMSMADLTMDLQHIRSVLLRNMLDNVYLSNNNRTVVRDRDVNLDDMLVSRPGGIVRAKGDKPLADLVAPIPHNPLPQEAFQMMEYLDGVRQDRTGAADQVPGLDKNSLASVNTGVAAMAYDASRMKIELIARIAAEIGFRPLFKTIHELLSKKQDKEMSIQVSGQFTTINPSDWRKRVNTSVNVGVGTVSRERKLMALDAIMGKQMEQVQMGAMGATVMPHQVFQSLSDWTDAWGLEGRMYFQDPRELPPPQPQQDPNADALMLQAQSMMVEAETKKEKNQIDMAKAQADVQLKMREQDLKMQEQELKAEIQAMNMKMQNMQNDTATDTKVASLELQMEKQDTENRIKQLQMALDANQAERDRQVDIYKIQMDNMAKLMQSHGITQDNGEREEREALEAGEKAEMRNWVGQLVAQNQVLAERLEEINTKASAPKVIKRDDKGLMVQFGDMPVSRDASGRITQVG